MVQTTLETITQTLAEGSRLEIRNFGVFELKVRDARIGRNPRTGATVPITQKRVPVFKPGKALKARVEHGPSAASGGAEAVPEGPSSAALPPAAQQNVETELPQ